jgi:hypothetical protein
MLEQHTIFFLLWYISDNDMRVHVLLTEDTLQQIWTERCLTWS